MNLIGYKFFSNIFDHDVFQTVFLIWLIVECAIFIFTFHKSFSKNSDKKFKDKGSFFTIVIGVYACIYFSFLFRNKLNLILPHSFFWVGIIFMSVGIVIRCWAVFTLRKFFSLSVIVESKQSIVSSGPYKLIRHPAYTGTILTLIGISISIKSIMSILTALIIISVVYGYRIKIEEKVLINSFGKEYLNYINKTWKLIPWVF
ncbi:isoprenylcysteine carboxylmethyltransferase family protein [Clostridium sp. JN-1]|jgi:protein-S-isoprenylcysteine O-methyltransferase Ste14|uniref:methyltransferase family protein n=1 Tax=Clostridium sp. JN-1 TaxID=2483110 RepID=UPI000F0B32E0|nr:isoprenylcysteine carboxylmethyltransferase family protein [Clostridium sp. JN-1]